MLKKKKNPNSAYIAGESLESNLLWIIPLLEGINIERNVNSVIFDKPIGNFIIKNKNIKKFLNKYKLKIFNKNHSKLTSFFQNLKITFIYFDLIFKFIFLFNKKKILKMNWFNSQIYHAYWDSCLISMKDSQLKPTLFQKLKNAITICKTINDFERIKKNNLNYVFLAHTVYKYRVIMALCRVYNIKIYTTANFNIQIQNKNYDKSWSYIDKSKLNLKIKREVIRNYWKKRLRGNSNYKDAQVASNIKTNISWYPQNVILLHIFKDSPFNVIDNKRIFFDYFDWISKTLDIINKSDEKWALRLHPNHKRWGENQILILKKILKNYRKNNLLIDNKLISNNEMFSKVRRVVTFSGTSHLEASCFGIKPIIISEVTLSKLNKKLVFKPKNLKEYEKLLLIRSLDNKFKQSKKVINLSKKIIYIRENLLSMKKNINTENFYKNDKKKFDIYLSKKILMNYKFLYKYMVDKGKVIGKK